MNGSLLGGVIRFFLEQKLVTGLLLLLIVVWGLAVAPFDWKIDWLPRDPLPVDAIPDLGENQQIVFTQWAGRSPQDVEDQVTYPLTAALLGVPGVRDVRSLSMFGLSSIFLIFEESIDFYWSRARILERLGSLPAGLLPEGLRPALGPDATALGQVFWYTLEGRDQRGEPAGGWDLHELRSVQDWYVRQALLSAEGISEVASIGGYVQEYQVDVDPDALHAHGVTLRQVFEAVAKSNLDVGAGVTEINRVEYIVRGAGLLASPSDLEESVVATGGDRVPIRIRDVARVVLGPAGRRGVLTHGGAEAVGGVVVVRYGYNPLAAIENVKRKIVELGPGLPAKAVIDWSQTTPDAVERFARENGFSAHDPPDSPLLDHAAWVDWLQSNPQTMWPEGIGLSRLEIVPFYDRTGLIHETLGTLDDALTQQILVTILVVVVMVFHLRGSLVIAAMLPLAVLLGFVFMKLFGVESNIVALAGIAIAIGTIVDMGIIITENALKHLKEAQPDEPRKQVVLRAVNEVAPAILTALATTVVSFLPVFTMTGAEGKMFRPLAFTKTFVLIGSAIVAIAIVPAAVHLLVAGRNRRPNAQAPRPIGRATKILRIVLWAGVALLACRLLAGAWEPLGPEPGLLSNLLFVALLVGGLLGLFEAFRFAYPALLGFFLGHKALFLALPVLLVIFGGSVWLGFDRVFGPVPAGAKLLGLDPQKIRTSAFWVWASHALPGLGREFLPPLDEGSFLWMPTTMPHASLGEALEVLIHQDLAISAIPEVESVTGKIGRVESALDPAPISMIETVIHYRPEYRTTPDGARERQWRDHIRSPEDIWEEITAAARMPGSTGAPKLQPIETRLVMLQTGMRAPMGIKLAAPDLKTLDLMAVELERLVRQVPAVDPTTVNADRVVGKPYLEIVPDREAIARYGMAIADVQNVIAVAIGGETVTTTVEGRERYPVRVRYPREMRGDPEAIRRIWVYARDGTPIPLGEVAEIRYTQGPQTIRSENGFLVSYITFGQRPGLAEVDAVERVRDFLQARIDSGELRVPPGVSWRFAGTYEHQLRASKTLGVVLPAALLIIFLLLYLQFKSTVIAGIVFAGVAVAWAGGFTMLHFYGQPWFADFELFGTNMRQLFQLHEVNLSVAVWVGFLALFGIAVDDGVVMATYLKQSLADLRPDSVAELRTATIAAGVRRVRPCLMTSATTLLALLPVLTSTGRGADLMIPMAIPAVGGMTLALLTMFSVPVLFCLFEEVKLRWGRGA